MTTPVPYQVNQKVRIRAGVSETAPRIGGRITRIRAPRRGSIQTRYNVAFPWAIGVLEYLHDELEPDIPSREQLESCRLTPAPTIATATGAVIAEQRHIDTAFPSLPRPTIQVTVGAPAKHGTLIGQLTILADILLDPDHPQHLELLALVDLNERSR